MHPKLPDLYAPPASNLANSITASQQTQRKICAASFFLCGASTVLFILVMLYQHNRAVGINVPMFKLVAAFAPMAFNGAFWGWHLPHRILSPSYAATLKWQGAIGILWGASNMLYLMLMVILLNNTNNIRIRLNQGSRGIVEGMPYFILVCCVLTMLAVLLARFWHRRSQRNAAPGMQAAA